MKKNANTMLDVTDLTILDNLQRDCRIKINELGKLVNLSETPCWRRWKRLEKEGIVTSYTAVLDRKKLGYNIIGFSQVTLNDHSPEQTDGFEQIIQGFDWVPMCFCITGSADFILQVLARDLDEYYDKISEIRRIKVVDSIQSNIAIKEIKNSSKLPLF
ncbi:MAG: DNA-binding Lrp family transcriptional regulator [Moritella sp.]